MLDCQQVRNKRSLASSMDKRNKSMGSQEKGLYFDDCPSIVVEGSLIQTIDVSEKVRVFPPYLYRF